MKTLVIAMLSAFIALTTASPASTIDVTFTAHDAVPVNVQAYLDLNYSIDFTGEDTFKFDNVTIDWGNSSAPTEDPFPPFGTHYSFAHLYGSEGAYTILATVLGRFYNSGLCAGGCSASGSMSAPIMVGPAAVTPIPPALPLFASALFGLGFAAWRRSRAS